MSQLPDIEDLYPHLVRVKHRGDIMPVALRIMSWLEGRGIMINKDFHLDSQEDTERLLVRFRNLKHAEKFTARKKAIRDAS